MDPRRQEDPNLGPTRTEAYNADTDMEPPSTNAVTESANVAYTESPLATLRKRDLEYRRLLHANSPDQRDPEKRSRSLPAEPNDDSMVSNSGSDLTPLPALDANAAKQSDLSDCLAEVSCPLRLATDSKHCLFGSQTMTLPYQYLTSSNTRILDCLLSTLLRRLANPTSKKALSLLHNRPRLPFYPLDQSLGPSRQPSVVLSR
ncbi:hypothetical protein Ae201684P_015202 [Aphanomyces euteiches]|nr:hypothetical protein Ae201684P_015202 [Aphanomyces euteiches]